MLNKSPVIVFTIVPPALLSELLFYRVNQRHLTNQNQECVSYNCMRYYYIMISIFLLWSSTTCPKRCIQTWFSVELSHILTSVSTVTQIHETIESINQLKIQRDFMLSFSRDPKGYIQDWICSQNRDLKVRMLFCSKPSEIYMPIVFLITSN